MSNIIGHVPAWKKLGLKLKYAKDDAPSPAAVPERNKPVNGQVETNGHKRRKLDSPSPLPVNVPLPPSPQVAVSDSPKPARKDKKEKHPKRASNVQTPEPEVEASVTPHLASSIKSNSHRKSVSFAHDAKSEDGQSSKDLYAEWTDREQEISDLVAGSYQPALQVVEAEPATIGERGEAVRKPKKAKKSKSTSLATKSASNGDSHGKSGSLDAQTAQNSQLVDYLETYHTARVHWKFNKARQNQTLKHLFDLDKLPPSVGDALLAYIGGLNSEPVRNRVREQAKEIIDKDVKEGLDIGGAMDISYAIDSATPNADGARNQINQKSTDEQRIHAAYLFGLRRFKKRAKHVTLEIEEEKYQLTNEWSQRLARRLRAERFLETLGEPVKVSAMTETRKKEGIDYHIERNVPTPVKASDGTITMKKKRKRKRRTGVPEDDSSSDESSSEDEDEEDRRISNKLTAAIQKADGEEVAAKIQAAKDENERIKGDTLKATFQKDPKRAGVMAKIFAQAEEKGISASKLVGKIEKLVDLQVAAEMSK